tara:strand:+ start:2339 stop:2800 length:462 start_codon:yes stop_codon:yes gene_type:complete
MEIILLENIKNLGKIGDLVNVKRGYGRNFLIKYGKALIASKSNIDLVNKKKDELNQKNLEQKKAAKKIFDIINNSRCKFVKKSKENGELYGSVRPAELSKNLSDLKKVEIKPSQIDIAKEIKKIGTYEAQINLHAEVQAKIHIEVVEEDKQKS